MTTSFPPDCHCGTPDCRDRADEDLCTKCLEGFEPNGTRACQDIDECDVLSNKPCGNNTCVNTVGSYRCKCQDENQESVGGMICTDKLDGPMENEKDGGRNSFVLPADPVAMFTHIGLSLLVIGFYFYVAVMDCFTVSRAIYRFVYTEPVLDGESDSEEDNNDEGEDEDTKDDVEQFSDTDQPVEEMDDTEMSSDALGLFTPFSYFLSRFSILPMQSSIFGPPIPVTRIVSEESLSSIISEKSKQNFQE